jgi:hypothetical protein
MGTTMYLPEHHFPNACAGVVHSSSLRKRERADEVALLDAAITQQAGWRSLGGKGTGRSHRKSVAP